MMLIFCPDNNRNEREYIIRFFFGGLLGIQTEISFDSNVSEYIIQLDDLRRIIVEDHFFNRFPEDLSYFRKDNLPDHLSFFHFEDEKIPIIYGRDYLKVETSQIVVGLDIFASSFFMLTRWEEYVLGREEKEYDSHLFYQVDEDLLFCVRQGMTDHLLVHEYEFLLRRLLAILGYRLSVERKPTVLITHDVDSLGARPVRVVMGHMKAFSKEGFVRKAWRWLRLNFKISLFCAKAWNVFGPYIREVSAFGFKNVFLFKCCQRGEVEYTYDISSPAAVRILQKLKKEQVRIGFHPSQSVFHNDSQFSKEYARFLKSVGTAPFVGRNHRLLHNIQSVHQWENSGTSLTSNWGYQTRIGFRCGIAIPFPVFDLYTRVTTRVHDCPFIIMDSALRRMSRTNRWGEDESRLVIQHTVKAVADVGGVVCINWHVNPFTKKEFSEGLQSFISTLRCIYHCEAMNFPDDGFIK